MARSIHNLTAGFVAAAVLLAGFVPGAAGAAPASETAEEINRLQEEARALETELEELGARASIVVEEYRVAEQRLAEADAVLASVRSRVETLRLDLETATNDAQSRIVAMYQGRGVPTPMAYLDAANASDLATRHHYADAVAAHDRSIIAGIDRARTELVEQEDVLEQERATVAQEAVAVRDKRDEVEAAVAARSEALARAEGELAELVEQERQRRQAEEEARVRAELERRRAEEAARRAEEEARRAATAVTSTTISDTQDAPAPAPAAPPPADLRPPHPNARIAVDAAMSKLGTPYQWGGNGPDSYDCSGLTTYAWREAGVSLPRSSGLQKAALPPVPWEHIEPGDLLFFGNPVHHVGLFIGDGKMVNAPYTGSSVRVDSIYRSDFAGAGRPG